MPMIDAKARATLDKLERQDALEREQGVSRQERLRQVTPDVGRFLHTLVLATRPGSILEVGTSGGYSTVWLATAARAVGGMRMETPVLITETGNEPLNKVPVEPAIIKT